MKGRCALKTKELTTVAFMTAILIILGFIPGIPLGIIPVPIVLQNTGIMLAGLVLGTKRGTLSVLLLLLLAAVGLPVLSGGRGGLPVLLGPTGGYLLGWLLTPFLTNCGLLLLGQHKKTSLQLLVIWFAGVICADLCGTLWLSFQGNISLTTALLSNLAFIPGDTIKAVLAFVMAKALKSQPLSQNSLL